MVLLPPANLWKQLKTSYAHLNNVGICWTKILKEIFLNERYETTTTNIVIE